MKLYNTKTQADYDALMVELEEKGYKWLSGDKPTFEDYWSGNKEGTCITISGKDITYGSIKWHKKEYPDTPIIEYKAKYCSMCGKKLIYEPEFKAGDIVASRIFADGSFGLVRLNEDLTNRFTSVDGFWYIKRDCAVRDESLVVFKEDTRQATPEEIAEYEAALSFHNHGRKPFEVKNGDLVANADGSKHFVENVHVNKELFLLNDLKLIATAEEVNEWLGVADETK